MHEMGIAVSILKEVEKELTKYPGKRCSLIGLRMGVIAGIDRDALEFGFNAIVRGSRWEPLVLRVQVVPRRQHCPKCDSDFETSMWETVCTRCGNQQTITVAGEELKIANIELEEVFS